jgi:hypothetical protein
MQDVGANNPEDIEQAAAVPTRTSYQLDHVMFNLAGRGDDDVSFWEIPIHAKFPRGGSRLPDSE